MASKNYGSVAVWSGLNAGAITFVGVWGYGVASNDWWMGLLFGWVPALIMSVIAGLVVFAVAFGLSGFAGSNTRNPDSSAAHTDIDPSVTLQ